MAQPQSTFLVYIDESGDEGFTFRGPGDGSSEWFVISAVVVRRAHDRVATGLVGRLKATFNRPANKPLHFRNLNHSQRVAYVAEIASQRLRTISVMVHKPSLATPETFRADHRLYWYATRFVLERVSWYCRDIMTPRDTGDGSAEIIFSNRRRLSYEDLGAYLRRLRAMDDEVSIDWGVIRPDQISAVPHDQRKGLQVVDAVASGTGAAINLNAYGHTENRYLRMLAPVLYEYSGRRWGYGIKVWPREAEAIVRAEARYACIREICDRGGPGL